jgi:hypothetical protein
MAKVKTNLSKLTVLEKVALGRAIVTGMTGNANYTTPAPALTALTTAATALETAYNAALAARDASKTATSSMLDKEVALEDMINLEAAYVQNASGGDRTKIESSGFDVANPNSPIGPLAAPATVEFDANVNPGNMAIKWKGVRGAVSYIVERASNDAPTDYVVVANPTAPRALVNTMVSGQKYWFRIAAVGAAGTGEWTSPAAKISP